MTNILKGRWVFDSNLLIYGLDKSSSHFEDVYHLFELGKGGKVRIVVAQQNISETVQAFVKGYKQSVEEVLFNIRGLLSELDIDIISPVNKTYLRFFDLLSNSSKPSDIFDYYLVATMLDNGINRILTVNTKDFSKIPGIEAVNPFK